MDGITRRGLLRLISGGVAAGFGAASAREAKKAPARAKHNVLFIAVDDLRPELGCYGQRIVKSPNIDRLAGQGTLFTHAYCQQAVCAPSRASLLSGCRPDTTAIYDLSTPLRKAMPDVLTLPQHFRNHGYRTIRLGKIYHHGSDDKVGWTEQPQVWRELYASAETRQFQRRRRAEARQKGWSGTRVWNYSVGPATECMDVADKEYGDGAITDEAIAQMRKQKGHPFFLAVGYWKPHLPFTAPRKYWDMYDRGKFPLPEAAEPADAPRLAFSGWGELRAYKDIPPRGDLDEAMTRKLIHGYHACVTYMDAQIGRLLGELERGGLRERTVIVLWGDHGWKLGEYGDWCKHTNFELDTHVPMIFAAPGTAGSQRCGALAEFVDIYPTLAELCGLPVPEHCEGTSLASLLKRPDRPWKKAAFSQYPRGKVMGYSLRTARWRYNEWIDRKTRRVVARELYDHREGPFARANLVDEPRHAERVKRLAALMKAGWRGALPPKGE